MFIQFDNLLAQDIFVSYELLRKVYRINKMGSNRFHSTIVFPQRMVMGFQVP